MMRHYWMDTDELWPYHEISTEYKEWKDPVFLDDDLVRRYNQAEKAFAEVRQELCKALHEGRGK